MSTCRVTIWDPSATGQRFKSTMRACDEATTGRLCAKHEADRVRLARVRGA